MKRNHGYLILNENSLSDRFLAENPRVKEFDFCILLVNKEIAEYPRINRMVFGYIWGKLKRCDIFIFRAQFTNTFFIHHFCYFPNYYSTFPSIL